MNVKCIILENNVHGTKLTHNLYSRDHMIALLCVKIKRKGQIKISLPWTKTRERACKCLWDESVCTFYFTMWHIHGFN